MGWVWVRAFSCVRAHWEAGDCLPLKTPRTPTPTPTPTHTHNQSTCRFPPTFLPYKTPQTLMTTSPQASDPTVSAAIQEDAFRLNGILGKVCVCVCVSVCACMCVWVGVRVGVSVWVWVCGCADVWMCVCGEASVKLCGWRLHAPTRDFCQCKVLVTGPCQVHAHVEKISRNTPTRTHTLENENKRTHTHTHPNNSTAPSFPLRSPADVWATASSFCGSTPLSQPQGSSRQTPVWCVGACCACVYI